MHAYWVKFETLPRPSGLNLGLGVTAIDWDDAQSLIRQEAFAVFGEAVISEVTVDVDVEVLDANHVRPNMGNPLMRGIWFPQTGKRTA